MAVKMTGAEFKRFHEDDKTWGEDAYYEDAVLTVDGHVQENGIDVSALADNAQVRIDGGYVFDLPGGKEMALESLFKKWKKSQSIVSFTVECDLNNVEAVKEAIKAAGGRAL